MPVPSLIHPKELAYHAELFMGRNPDNTRDSLGVFPLYSRWRDYFVPTKETDKVCKSDCVYTDWDIRSGLSFLNYFNNHHMGLKVVTIKGVQLSFLRSHQNVRLF